VPIVSFHRPSNRGEKRASRQILEAAGLEQRPMELPSLKIVQL
jgi:hypothetical protein